MVIGEGEAVIYIGKAVCPYCQIFVKKLKKVAEETDTLIYYVNSAEESDWEGITAFRNEYDIPTVPGLIYTNSDIVNVKCDSSMPEEEIKAFINK
ncbi:thiol reductase thioredoxin [Litoribacterium kuwaitense]|uniref:thiol reductase thioredoxin n=1 Tax=Litoribacterium kuwaitense TaxID=1398745 RepID=UPI001FE78B2C|nr:thiol reductase thioredoxin [Litoribacterium kuwaitense]